MRKLNNKLKTNLFGLVHVLTISLFLINLLNYLGILKAKRSYLKVKKVVFFFFFC